MNDGSTTLNVDPVSISDEILVNRAGSTGRQAVDQLALQLSASGPLATAIQGAAAGLVRTATLAALSAIPGVRNGQPGEVSNGSDKGAYSWNGVSWVRVADLFDAAALDDMLASVNQLREHVTDLSNPHDVTKDQLGLGKVDNTADIDKPVTDPMRAFIGSVGNVSTSRPGDAPQNFIDRLDGGLPLTIPIMTAGNLVYDENGRVLRLKGGAVIGMRPLFALEPSKAYLASFVVQRRTNSSDPSNDAVDCAIAWYDQGGNRLSTLPQTSVQTFTDLTVSNGRTVASVVFSRAGGEGILVPPSEARYARPYVHVFGSSPTTDIEMIHWEDITHASTYSPDVEALDARVSAIEAFDLPGRTSTIESQVTAPNVVRLGTVGELNSATVPVSADVVELLGYSEAGDGAGFFARRLAAIEAARPGEQTSNGGSVRWGIVSNGRVKAEWFDAKLDDDTDDTAAINAAVQLAKFTGMADADFGGAIGLGGIVELPPGVAIITGLVLDDRVILRGAGMTATVLKLADGANNHVVATRDFDSLVGTNPPSDQNFGPRSCGIMDLTVDGNKTNQTVAKHGFAFFGIDLVMQNVTMRNCSGKGWYSEVSHALYSPLVNQNLQGRAAHIRCFDNDGGNIDFNGPSDMAISDIRAYNCPKTTGIYNMHVGPKAGGVQINDSLFWAGGQYGFLNECAQTLLSNVTIDQAGEVNLRLNATIKASQLFIYDSLLSNSLVGIEIADGVGFNHIPDAKIRNQLIQVRQLGSSAGQNKISAECYNAEDTAMAFSGTESATDDYDIHLVKPTPEYFVRKPGPRTFRGLVSAIGGLQVSGGSVPAISSPAATANGLDITTQGPRLMVGGIEILLALANEVVLRKPLRLPTYTTVAANALAGLNDGDLIIVSDGNHGAPCLAIRRAGAWRMYASEGSVISAT